MNAVLEKVGIAEYLKNERASHFRTEYIQGELRTLTGASFIHNKITMNLIKVILFGLSKSNKWEILSSDMKVWIPSKQTFYYPDILILLKPPEFYDEQKDIITNPVCIFEILSDSTKNFGKGEKFDAYRTIPHFQEYYLVEQNQILITQYIKLAPNQWEMKEYTVSSEKLPIPLLELELNLNEIYEGVEW